MAEDGRFHDFSEARETYSPGELRFERGRRTVGLFAGPVVFAVALLLPPDLPSPAARLVAVLAWVITWWATEAVPIPVTAVLGPALAVVCGVDKASAIFAPFGDPIIFLFLGSFVLAEGMQTAGLDRRIAYSILAAPIVGSSTTRVLLAFAGITASLSMWLSNTAVAAMMYPIAMGVITALTGLLERTQGPRVPLTRPRFATGLMLAVAYAASIGGVATPIGTPPNLIAIGQLEALAQVRIPFLQWMLLGVPVMVLLLLILVIYLRWALPPEVREIPGSRELIAAERAGLGPWRVAEKNVALAFAITVTLWIAPGALALVLGTESATYRSYQAALPEGVVALLGAGLLFVLPVSWAERRFTIGWREAARIDWGTLLLFGGGLALGGAMFRSGLGQAVGEAVVSATGAHSPLALTYLFGAAALLLTETTSNTAAATMVCPLAIAAAQAAGVSPVAPAAAVALCSSMAFMLPVSTPPNAIVYSSGCVPITVMLRHGVLLDLCCLAIAPGAALLLCGALGW